MIPLGSGPVIAILLGVFVGAAVGPRRSLVPGIASMSSAPLRAAVVVLGAELPLGAVVAEGVQSLPVIAITLGGCLLAASVLGRALSIPDPLRTLVGVGTGICGASAIAAVSPVIEAGGLDVGYAVATIFLFNVLAVLTFPPLGHLLGLGPHAYGVFAGTAVNDLSSVVAAASVYHGALHTAVIVKLARTLMIVPICLVLSIRRKRARGGSAGAPPFGLLGVVRLVPGFLVGFLALAALSGFGAIPHGLTPAVSEVATLLITLALAAVGLSIDLAGLRAAGSRPILLGAALWVTTAVLSLAAQALRAG